MRRRRLRNSTIAGRRDTGAGICVIVRRVFFLTTGGSSTWQLLLGAVAFLVLLTLSWLHHDALYAQYKQYGGIIVIDSSSSNNKIGRIALQIVETENKSTILQKQHEQGGFNQTTKTASSTTDAVRNASSRIGTRKQGKNDNDDYKSSKQQGQKKKTSITSSNRTSGNHDAGIIIPHRLIFTYHTNILQTKQPPLYYQNIRNTIQVYQQVWKKKQNRMQQPTQDDNATTTTTTTNAMTTDAALFDMENDTDNDIADVWFLTDQDCLNVIEQVEPRLSRHFSGEKRGDFKSDICRVVALYQRGGYYFDVDMLAVQAVILDLPAPCNIRFASVLIQGDYFFQSFLAAEARSPIIWKTIEVILSYYEIQAQLQADYREMSKTTIKKNTVTRRYSFNPTVTISWSELLQPLIAKYEARLGPFPQFQQQSNNNNNNNVTTSSSPAAALKVSPYAVLEVLKKRNIEVHLGKTDLVGVGSLRTAYRQVVLQADDNGGAVGDGGDDGVITVVARNETLLLQETELTPDMYPHLPRQGDQDGNGVGPYCNYIVHSPEQQQVYFFSRFLGTPKCRIL